MPCHHIREYRYVYGAVEPLTGESCFVVMPYCNTESMNVFYSAVHTGNESDRADMERDKKTWFKNEVFKSLQKVVDRLCNTICSLSNETIKSITERDWILSCF